MSKMGLKILALASALLFPAVALAVPAIVTSDLNYRSGPGVRYQRLGTLPAGFTVEVDGCIRGFSWCQVVWPGGSGWVSGRFLAYLEGGYRRAPLPSVGLAIGVPIITFEINRWDRDWPRYRRWHRPRPPHYGWGPRPPYYRPDPRPSRPDRPAIRRPNPNPGPMLCNGPWCEPNYQPGRGDR